MFRSSIIIREHALTLAKVKFILKHSLKLCRYLLCGCVQHIVKWRVCCMHSMRHTRHSI